MSITATISQLTNWNVSLVPESEGVYELSDILQNTIYIGKSDNIKQRLYQHLNTNDSCISNAKYFRYEVIWNSERRERELLEEFQRRTGRLPRCNDRIG